MNTLINYIKGIIKQEYILFNNIIPKVEQLLFSKTKENIKTFKKI